MNGKVKTMNLFAKLMNKLMLNVMIKKGRKGLHILDENSKHAKQINDALLFKLLSDNADTEYGKKYHFKDIKTIEEYKAKVPFTTYDNYAEYIGRMTKNNEKNLITVYPIVHYAMSSGSVGVPKHIPVSEGTMHHYSLNGAARIFAAADEYYRKKTGKGFPAGRGLNTMEVSIKRTENGISKGAISGAAVASIKSFLPYLMTSPNEIVFPEEQMNMKYMKLRYALMERDLVFMTSAFMTGLVDLMNYLIQNWELMADDIEKGTIDPSIRVSQTMREKLEANIKPDPKRAEEIRSECRKGFDTPIIPRLWKKMSWISAIGTGGFAGHTDRMRVFAGPDIPIDFMAYAASESLMAVARHPEEMEYVLLPDAAYYEFISMDDDDENTTYSLDQLKVGKDYELVLTNLSGFYRYRIKDVVRITGYYGTIPKLRFVYRKNQMLSIAGEKTNEESVFWAVEETAKTTKYKFPDFCVYADTESNPGHYVALLEPDKPFDMKELAAVRDKLDEKLGIANPSYGSKVKNGILGKLELHISQMETHALYRDMMIAKGISSNQLKPVRVLDTPIKERFFFGLLEEE